MRVGPHPPGAGRRQRHRLGKGPPVGVEELCGPVAAQPLLQGGEVGGVGAHLGQRHLVRAPGPLDGDAVDLGRARPPLRGAQHEHRPAGRPAGRRRRRLVLEGGDLVEHRVQRGRHDPVEDGRVVALDHVRGPAVALQQLVQLFGRDPGQHRRVGDLPPVEMQDRQDGAVVHRVEELVAVPRRRQRAGLRLAVADDAGHQQAGVVERRPEGVGQRVAQLAPLVDRARRLRRGVARDAAGEGELAEQPLHPVAVPGHRRIHLAVGPLQPRVGHHARPAVARPADEDGVEVAGRDHPVQMGVDEVEPRRRPPVAEQTGLHVLERERLREQRVR